jgi:hypothetical protein
MTACSSALVPCVPALHLRAREKRRREEELRATVTLGAAGDDVDDLANWASRVKPQSAAAAGAGAGGAGSSRPSKRHKGQAAAAEGAGDEEDEEGHTAADLEGVRVRHDLEGLTEGETVVLTLADTGGCSCGTCVSL